MNERKNFLSALTSDERRVVRRLSSPEKIQSYLDTLTYSSDDWYRSPIQALRDGRAHCYDGAVLGAALLFLIGYSPLIINMFPTSRDDEHLVAPFRRFGAWGAVGKSNFVGLRYREPIHKTMRELIISYFEQYYNVAGEKTLRSYTKPLDLSTLRVRSWMTDPAAMDRIADKLERMKRYPVLTPQMIRGLAAVDPRSYKAGLQGSIPDGLFKVTSGPSSPNGGSSRHSG